MRWHALLLLIPLLAVGGCPNRPAVKTSGAAAAPSFSDVTASAGIRFRHFSGADGRYFMPESVGCGGGFLDYDGDGWQDIFLVNSTSWPDRPGSRATCAL